ncbi:hypothetical protein MLD52_18945 [Puniceicoccaceae bacterium K14]|nr:hypothetical protein [Puniceicoccaceae bacterium K14]
MMNELLLVLFLVPCMCCVAFCEDALVITKSETVGYIVEDGMPFLVLSKPLSKVEFSELTLNELLTSEYSDNVSEASWLVTQIKEKSFDAVLVRGPESKEVVRLIVNQGKLIVDFDYERQKSDVKVRRVSEEELKPALDIYLKYLEAEKEKIAPESKE